MRDAGEISHRIIGIDGCVGRRINDGAQASRIIVHVADIGGGTSGSDERKDERSDHYARAANQPMSTNSAIRRSSLLPEAH